MTTTQQRQLQQKVRYQLHKMGETLVIPRGCSPLGIHVVDSHTGVLIAQHCTIEALASELENA
jgi:hypothetical protein